MGSRGLKNICFDHVQSSSINVDCASLAINDQVTTKNIVAEKVCDLVEMMNYRGKFPTATSAKRIPALDGVAVEASIG